MNFRSLFLGIVLLSMGCPPGMGDDGGDDIPDMARPPDLRSSTACAGDGEKATGEPCTRRTRCECSGDKPFCLEDFTFGSDVFPMEGGYCSTTSCSADTDCGDSGVCAETGGGNYCLRSCRKGQCRDTYTCMWWETRQDGPVRSLCLPSEPFVDCNPTMPEQCSMLGMITNGDKTGGCVRRGPDDAGTCLFVPCSVGPKNCPPRGGTPTSCIFFDLSRLFSPNGAPTPGDKYEGTWCLPLSNPKALDQDCRFVNECQDNLVCAGNPGKCRQTCYKGTQPFPTGGNPMYKNPATACPAMTTCETFVPGAAAGPGWCRPN